MTGLLHRVSTPIVVGLTFSLVSCSSQVAVTPLRTAQSSISSGATTRGVITAARSIPLDGNQNSIDAGLSGVLAAIHEPKSQATVNATEFVIQRSDDTTVSIVARSSSGSFSIGDRVLIIDGAQPRLIHGD